MVGDEVSPGGAPAELTAGLRAGYDALEHATFMDAESLELLLARDVPVVPALPVLVVPVPPVFPADPDDPVEALRPAM